MVPYVSCLVGNKCLTVDNIALNEWTDIEVSQRVDGESYRWSVKVYNQVIGSEVNTYPRVFENVKVFVSDKHHTNAQGTVKNIVIQGRKRQIHSYSI